MLMRISIWIYNCSSRYTFQIIIPKVCLLPLLLLLLSSHSCPTKIELQEGRRGFHVLGSSPGLSREARFHEHGLGARVYPWITRRCTNSPDFFLLLPLLPFLPVDLRFHLGPLFLPPRPSLSLSLFSLRFLALPRLKPSSKFSLSLSLCSAPRPSPLFFVSVRVLEAGTGPAITRSRLTVAPCMAACFMLAALHCDARRGARARAPRPERCGSKHARMYPPRISPRRAFK